MATAAENITEPGPAPEVPTAEPTIEAGSTEDAIMDDSEEGKRLRAASQSQYNLSLRRGLHQLIELCSPTVEFYFADANLPYDKCVRTCPYGAVSQF